MVEDEEEEEEQGGEKKSQAEPLAKLLAKSSRCCHEAETERAAFALCGARSRFSLSFYGISAITRTLGI